MRRGRNNIFGTAGTRCVRPCVTRVIGSQLDFKGRRSPSSAPTPAQQSASVRRRSLVRLSLLLDEDGPLSRADKLARDEQRRRRGGYVKITRAMRGPRVRRGRRIIPVVNGGGGNGGVEVEPVEGNTHAPGDPSVEQGQTLK